MTQIAISLPEEASSTALASRMATVLHPPAVLGFSGQLGAGKTSIIRAILRALGIAGAIKSPTYTLVESYACPKFHLHHFDLYRIVEDDELECIGFRDFFTEDSVCCIEWPEKSPMSMAMLDVHGVLDFEGQGRRLVLHALTSQGARLLEEGKLPCED